MIERILLAALLVASASCGALDESPRRQIASDGATMVPDLGAGSAASDSAEEEDADGGAVKSADSRRPDGPAPFVKIMSPADKATVKNPVSFNISAGLVATVKLTADGWPLADPFSPTAKTSVSYQFIGLNYPRLIRLEGHDAKGATVALHEIHITVSN